MVDITERKQAEQALQASERKYSEAFRREREAAQQLEALDDMKNTFLEAVSHDLRTPLTVDPRIGDHAGAEPTWTCPQEDAVDLVRRIAANARKLERLLGDLLDLDRLQRGIVSPQRRPTDVGEPIRRAVGRDRGAQRPRPDRRRGTVHRQPGCPEGRADRREPRHERPPAHAARSRGVGASGPEGRRPAADGRGRRDRGSRPSSERRSSNRSARPPVPRPVIRLG